MVFPTIDGSSSFQVSIFTPNSNTFRASPYLCSCECCIKQKYGSCPLFEEYELTSMTLIKHAMRSQNQQSFQPGSESNEEYDDENNLVVHGFFPPNSICAIAAAELSRETGFFVRIIENDCVSDNIETDDFNHKVLPGQYFLKAYYPEKASDTKKGYVYTENTRKIVFIFRETIVYPFVSFKKRQSKLFYISMEHFCEILYFVDGGMASLV